MRRSDEVLNMMRILSTKNDMSLRQLIALVVVLLVLNK
jgi:hypothetical protein